MFRNADSECGKRVSSVIQHNPVCLSVCMQACLSLRLPDCLSFSIGALCASTVTRTDGESPMTAEKRTL